MPKETARSTPFPPLGIAIAAVQVVDILIHAATDQIEPIRVLSNVVVLLWLGLVATGRVKGRLLPLIAVITYLLLNALFLVQAGVTNPQQGGVVRWMLLLLVALTLALAARLIYRIGATGKREKDTDLAE